MKASFRKTGDHFYGVTLHEGRLLWLCPHNHPTRRKASACARRHLKEVPSTRREELRQLRRTWTPTESFIPTDPDDGRPILSRTFIDNFLQCVQYSGDRSPEAAFGTAVHAAIHAYYQLCVVNHQESMLSEVDRIVRDAYFATPTGIEPSRYEEAKELVYDYVSNHMAALDRLLVVDGHPALEFELRADCGWFWMIGRADRIDRTDGEDPDDPPRIIRIKDFKTGWDPQARVKKILDRPNNPYPAPVPHDFQRRTYAMAAFLDPRLNPRLEAVETVIDYPRSRREPEVITYEKGQLDGWWDEIKWALTQRWQQRSGPPTGCAACEYCSLRLTCGAAMTEARAIPSTVEEAKVIASDWVRGRQLQSGRSRALQKFMKGREMLVLNGLEIGYAPPREATFKASDPLGIVNALNAHGLNGQAAMITWIDAKMIPDDLKASLVEAGVARWDPGDVGWKMRKAGTDEEPAG